MSVSSSDSSSPSVSAISPGQLWPRSSLLAGKFAGQGKTVEIFSPLDGKCIQQVQLLNELELAQLQQESPIMEVGAEALHAFCERLSRQLELIRPLLVEATQLETGFTPVDCEEMVQGSLSFVHEFPHVLKQWQTHNPPWHYDMDGQTRNIELYRCAWGTVAVILPQNAFLLVAVTCLLNALAAGNRVVLRAPLQAARSAALLATAIQAAREPWGAINLVNARAQDLLSVLYQTSSPVLIHYMGGSSRAADLIGEAFNAGKAAIVDGSGNSLVWIDENTPLETALKVLVDGATRYNGQTCTSINGAVIHPHLYPQLKARLQEQWSRLTCGNPLEQDVQVGPLFDEKQAQWCQQQVENSGGTVLCGGGCQGNLLEPTLVDAPLPTSTLVAEGVFGPILWIAPGDAAAFCELWRRNRYPLSAAIFSGGADFKWWAQRLPNLSRLVLNNDPSIEYIHEPWGGYPSSSANTVGRWIEKYTRVVQVDYA
jgi:acyl-CoA reductase-like NAD-dependent aldehyde dehydrogenase